MNTAAIHEAAHSIIAIRLGRQVGDVQLGPNGTGSAVTNEIGLDQRNQLSPKEWAEQALRESVIYMAGPECDRKVDGYVDTKACASDLDHAANWLKQSQSGLRIRDVAQRAERLLDEPKVWRGVQRLSEMLLLKGRCSAADVQQAYSGQKRRTQLSPEMFDRYYQPDGRPRAWFRESMAKIADAQRARTMALDAVPLHTSGARGYERPASYDLIEAAYRERRLEGTTEKISQEADNALTHHPILDDMALAAARTQQGGGCFGYPGVSKARERFRRSRGLDYESDRDIDRLMSLEAEIAQAAERRRAN